MRNHPTIHHGPPHLVLAKCAAQTPITSNLDRAQYLVGVTILGRLLTPPLLLVFESPPTNANVGLRVFMEKNNLRPEHARDNASSAARAAGLCTFSFRATQKTAKQINWRAGPWPVAAAPCSAAHAMPRWRARGVTGRYPTSAFECGWRVGGA